MSLELEDQPDIQAEYEGIFYLGNKRECGEK